MSLGLNAVDVGRQSSVGRECFRMKCYERTFGVEVETQARVSAFSGPRRLPALRRLVVEGLKDGKEGRGPWLRREKREREVWLRAWQVGEGCCA